jgi:hypothetical protein
MVFRLLKVKNNKLFICGKRAVFFNYCKYLVAKDLFSKPVLKEERLLYIFRKILHRDNKPALYSNHLSSPKGTLKIYYKHGVITRKDGPALIYKKNREYYIDGVRLSFKDWFFILPAQDKAKLMIKSPELFSEEK